MPIDPAAIESLQALAVGFAFAGLVANFTLLQAGGLAAVACVPLVVFCAPFIILRNTIRGRRLERRPMSFVMLATILACVWSLISGRLVLDVAQIITGA